MDFAVLHEGRHFRILAEYSELYDAFNEHLQRIQIADSKKIIKRFRLCCEGNDIGNKKVCHEMCYDPTVWRWWEGNYRYGWRYGRAAGADGVREIVFTNWFQKTNDGPTPQRYIDIAQREFGRIGAAIESDQFIIIQLEDEGHA